MNSPRAGSSRYRADLFAGFSGRWCPASHSVPVEHPLIVAVHGGTYTSRYFDIPGFSLLDRAEALGVPVLALDRPGYGQSMELDASGSTLRGNADMLRNVLGDAWDTYRGSALGIVLIAHSIGAAISLLMAGESLEWPLLGLAVSGVGLRTPPEHLEAWKSLPETYRVEIPAALKDQVMFGPEGSYDSRMPVASHEADAPAPKAELVDIVGTWHERVRDVLARVPVPVHYRQGEFDGLWIVDQQEVKGFGEAFVRSPLVDARMLPGVGHCIDFHRCGAAFHTQQLGFALQCAAETAILRAAASPRSRPHAAPVSD